MVQENLPTIQLTDQSIFGLLQQLFDQIEELDSIAQPFPGAAPEVEGADQPLQHAITRGYTAVSDSPKLDEMVVGVQQNVEIHKTRLRQLSRQLQQKIRQLHILHTIANQFGETVGIERVLTTAMEAVWQKTSLRFAVIILGETELGPYIYHTMRGIAGSQSYLGLICPFPLWGVLARALLPRLNPDEPDFLIVKDIARENLPLPEEFPWMPRDGSLMILPLRADNRAQGAILLGSQKVNAFADEVLYTDYVTIANQVARVLHLAKMHHELNDRSSQLLSLQLFTKSIASAKNQVKLVDILIEGILEAMGCVGVSVIIGDQLWHREIDGSTEIPAHFRRIIDWSMQAGQPIFYDPEDTEGSLERFYYNESGHALVVPIIGNERTQGAIQITSDSNSRRFEEGDMIVLRTIANCAAIMLHGIKG
ncbi:MAG: GAF domain-containing protein [Caldilineaceae bacterium]